MSGKISIIVPCYNQAAYIAETLESVKSQTFENWECIIVNDGSTDNSEQIAKEFTDDDKRFKYFLKENGGLSSARNYGIEKSDGDYILPLDADDRISKTYINEALELFSIDQNIDLIYGRAEYFEEKTGEWNLPVYSYEKILLGNQIYCSCIYKRNFPQNGLYDENMKSGYEDWEFLIRNLNSRSVVRKLESVVFFYRIKKQSMWTVMTSSKRAESKIIEYVFMQNIKQYTEVFGRLYTIKKFIKFRLKNNFYIFFKAINLMR